MVDVNTIFSPVAFFIFMRETLEASVIVAVLLQCMNRTFPRLKRWGEQTGAPLVAVTGNSQQRQE
jgi:high-affinity Fe2+/Pb2+ permease